MTIDNGKYTIVQDEEAHHILIFENIGEGKRRKIFHSQCSGPLLNEEELAEYLKDFLSLWSDIKLAKMIKEDME